MHDSVESEAFRHSLKEMFDPFTADHALALAYSSIGRPADAAPLLAEIRDSLPEWTGRPRR